ncbi:phosphatidylinositol-specific phospholipase C1-like protein [Echinicola rosea]|nr:phosphatidylinositol-specific phospholipase C1-like protein [Echinicola rosea]
MKSVKLLIVAIITALIPACNPSKEHKTEKALRLNDIQVIGSHNSYKIAIEPEVMTMIAEMDSNAAISLEYDHLPLNEQLELGLRNLELDVFHDPVGGRYSEPKALAQLDSAGTSHLPFDEAGKLDQAGLKLFHVQDIDFRSHHLLFKDALNELSNWSYAHSEHSPIIILINAKDGNSPQMTPALPFTAAALDSIDKEIRSVFPKEKLITPDMVRGEYASLEEAVLAEGWPLLEEVKGRFLFVLDEKEEKNNRYRSVHPNLEDAVLFINVKEGNPNAGFRIINDPVANHDYIQDLVSKGYMVRTRADAGTKEARNNDYSRFEKAKSSGAQVISTDYYIPSGLFESDYKVVFEDNAYERKMP